MTPSELEDRLINFAVLVIYIADNLKNTRSASTMANQIVRSGTSPALNYGEAQSAESSNDFIHKCQVVLKELRETYVSLKIISRAELCNETIELQPALNENNELISIFVATVNKLKSKKIK
jgi:four helix bundle protein